MASTPLQTVPAEMREEIELLIEHVVDQRLAELIGDPDEGLLLREEVVRRLREQQKRVAAGELGISFAEVQRRLGLE